MYVNPFHAVGARRSGERVPGAAGATSPRPDDEERVGARMI